MKLKNKAGVVHEYAHLAARYDKRWAFYVSLTVQETIKRLHLKSEERVLDVGCGTGELLMTIGDKFPELEAAGVDPSREMLQVARQKLADSVILKEGWAEDLPFQNKSFDVIVSCSAFHFFKEPMRALREFRRVLKPNGRIVITDWCHDYFTCRVHDFFLRLFNQAHSKTYGSGECEILLRESGFKNIKVERYKMNWLWGMMTIQA